MPLSTHIYLVSTITIRVIRTGGSSTGHRHPGITTACTELPAHTAIPTLGKDRPPVLTIGISFGHHQEGIGFQSIEGGTVSIGHRQIIIRKLNSGQSVLCIGLVVWLSSGCTHIGDTGMIFLIGKISPEKHTVSIGGCGDHEWTGSDGTSDIPTTISINGGDLCLG